MVLKLLSLVLLFVSAEVAIVTQGFRLPIDTNWCITRRHRRRIPAGARATDDPEDSSSKREDLRRALQYARKYDAEWLQNVFGDKLPQFLDEDAGGSGEREPSSEESSVSDAPEEIDPIAFQEFDRLGYSESEVSLIKPSVRAIILDRKVPRPRRMRDLPEDWLIARPLSDDKSQRPAGVEETYSSSRQPSGPRRASVVTDDDDWSVQPASSESYRGERTRRVDESSNRKSRRGSREKNEGEAFAWKGKPPTVVEIENSIDFPGDDEDYIFSSDSGDDLSFWPDQEEFKDMIIEESKARIEVTGDWIKPLVKEEAKWRYGIYKWFLKFVGEGLSDSYDVESLDSEDNLRQNKNKQSLVSRRRTEEDSASRYDAWLNDRVDQEVGWTDAADLPYDNMRERNDSPVNKDDWFSAQDTNESDKNWNMSWLDADDSSFDLISRARNEISTMLDEANDDDRSSSERRPKANRDADFKQRGRFQQSSGYNKQQSQDQYPNGARKVVRKYEDEETDEY